MGLSFELNTWVMDETLEATTFGEPTTEAVDQEICMKTFN